MCVIQRKGLQNATRCRTATTISAFTLLSLIYKKKTEKQLLLLKSHFLYGKLYLENWVRGDFLSGPNA